MPIGWVFKCFFFLKDKIFADERRREAKFRNKHYALSDGLPMGSPASPVIANIYMRALEERALSTFELKPKVWYRYVDDVFSITKKDTRSETTPTPQQPTSLNSFHRGVRERREIAILRGQHQPHGRQTRPLYY